MSAPLSSSGFIDDGMLTTRVCINYMRVSAWVCYSRDGSLRPCVCLCVTVETGV